MTIKERLNIRFERIKKYRQLSKECREIKSVLEGAEKSITKLLDADKVDDTYVCIKKYSLESPAINISEIGDNVFFYEKYCHRFDNNMCPIFNCPYVDKNHELHRIQKLYEQTLMNKKIAFNNMFERIK